MSETFRSSEIGLKVQKKLAGKMASKNVARSFIQDHYARILDNLYQLVKAYTQNKKEAEKVVKNIIKIVVKMGVLSKNDQFTKHDLNVAKKLRMKFSTIVKTVISFVEVEFSFDRAFLMKNIEDCRSLLKTLVGNHLTDKSLQRIDHVLDFFGSSSFLDEIFKRDSKHRPTVQAIVGDLNKAVDAGEV